MGISLSLKKTIDGKKQSQHRKPRFANDSLNRIGLDQRPAGPSHEDIGRLEQPMFFSAMSITHLNLQRDITTQEMAAPDVFYLGRWGPKNGVYRRRNMAKE